MSDIKEKISSILPGAVFTEGETLMVTVEEKDWQWLAWIGKILSAWYII